MDTNDGGSAFPFNECNSDGSHYHSHPGASLRDWFAGQALNGMLSRDCDFFPGDLAKRVYAIADAMLAARSVEGQVPAPHQQSGKTIDTNTADDEDERDLSLIRIFHPKIYIDGDMWCCLLGDNLQDGVCGFGDSPYMAALNFCRAFKAASPHGSNFSAPIPGGIIRNAP